MPLKYFDTMVNLNDFGFEISGTPAIEQTVFNQTKLTDFGMSFCRPVTTLDDFKVR